MWALEKNQDTSLDDQNTFGWSQSVHHYAGSTVAIAAMTPASLLVQRLQTINTHAENMVVGIGNL